MSSSWICRGCGRESIHIRTIVDGDELVEQCDHPQCGNLAMADTGIPDVYVGRLGNTFQNLCDDTGKPYEITSKRQKKAVMDKLGVSEAGDRVNGAPYGSKTWIEGTRAYRKKQFEKDRPAIREIYRRYLENARHK